METIESLEKKLSELQYERSDLQGRIDDYRSQQEDAESEAYNCKVRNECLLEEAERFDNLAYDLERKVFKIDEEIGELEEKIDNAKSEEWAEANGYYDEDIDEYERLAL